MSTQIWISSIVAATSLLVALLSAWLSRRTQRHLAELSDRFEEQRAERDARRDYEYDARKRLYAECEPVLFEAMELAETFRRRVVSLARAAQRGALNPDGSGWLSESGYYFRSTAYYLLAPATSVKILQRRLTAVDLAVEPRIKFQYQLIKELFHAYTWDHDLAHATPALTYQPDAPTVETEGSYLAAAPQPYRRQGLYLGILDQIADALTVKAGDAYRCKSLGEFWIEFDKPETALGMQRADITALLVGFHPAQTPVLWRVLVSQYLLFGVLLRSRDARPGARYDPAGLLTTPDDALRQGLDWRRNGDDALLEEVRTPLVVGYDHLVKRLAYLADHTRQ